jgi:hypothetical protein
MTPATPHLKTLATWLPAILDRLEKLEVQVRGLVTSQTLEAKEFVVRDDRGEIHTRLEMQEYAPRLIFYHDRLGKERLRIELRPDDTPSMWVERREIPLMIPEHRG